MAVALETLECRPRKDSYLSEVGRHSIEGSRKVFSSVIKDFEALVGVKDPRESERGRGHGCEVLPEIENIG